MRGLPAIALAILAPWPASARQGPSLGFGGASACAADLCVEAILPGTVLGSGVLRAGERVLGSPGPPPKPALPDDLGQARAYPNPLRAGAASCLRFDRLPAGTRIRIFTLAGRLAAQANLGLEGSYCWDLRDRSGEPVASGFYIGVLDAGGASRRQRLAILR